MGLAILLFLSATLVKAQATEPLKLATTIERHIRECLGAVKVACHTVLSRDGFCELASVSGGRNSIRSR
jgi:hypothetical protein